MPASKSLMAHLVLGYPTLAESIRTAEVYISAGCGILELQVPFSHPTADGPVITAACREAVEKQGVRVEDCIDALKWLRGRHPEQEIMVMSYANRIYAYGAQRFAGQMQDIGIKHLIVPDLPVDAPLSHLFSIGGNMDTRAESVSLVPVIAANITPERLQRLVRQAFGFFYLMSDFKITGGQFSLHPGLLNIISYIRRENPSARIGIGFGISEPEQVREVLKHADVAIVGSSIIKARYAGSLAEHLASLLGAVQTSTNKSL